MEKNLTVALVGYGYWGPNLLRNFLQHPSITVKWVVDLDEKNLKKAQSVSPAISVTQNIEDVLQDSQVDLVALAVPTKLHFPLAKQALLAKKHVLVEKPITQTVADATELQKIAKQCKRFLFVDHPYVFSAPVQYLKKTLQEKTLGDLFYIESRRLNLGLIQPDINVIDDLSPHDFSILDYVLDGAVPQHIAVQGSRYTNGKQVERAVIELQYENNVSATIHLSWLSPLKVREMFCVGSKKMIVIDDSSPSEKLRIYDKGVDFQRDSYTPLRPFYRSGDVIIPQLPNTEPLGQMIDACYQRIVNNTKAPNEVAAAIRVVSLIERAQAALQTYQKEIYAA